MEERKKLYLSRTDRQIAGFCGGLADYFNIDSSLIRLIYILITFLTGIIGGLIVYIIAWLIVPHRPPSQKQQTQQN
ncbi:MAG: PspC domain-containing protein [Acidobacteriota bacterium]